MVEIRTFMEGFDDLERMCKLREEMNKAKYSITRIVLGSSLGSLDDKSIFTDEERARFAKLSSAIDSASDMLYKKIKNQEERCVRINVTGFSSEEPKEDVEETKEDEFF